MEPIAGVFYNVKNGLSFVTSKSWSKDISNEITQNMFPENWHFNSSFVLKTTKTTVFFSLLRLFDKLFYIINDDPLLTL